MKEPNSILGPKFWKPSLLAAAIALASQPSVAVDCGNNITTNIGSCDVDAASQTISVSENGSITADGTNIRALRITTNGQDAVITNNGTITSSQSNDSITTTARAIATDDTFTGTITNTGTINSTATSTSTAVNSRATGIDIDGDLDGSFINSGTVNSNSTSAEGDAYVYGVRIKADLNGTLTNEGSISAQGTAMNADSSVDAYGIAIDGDVNGDLINNNKITVTGIVQGNSDDIDAYGIFVQGTLAATGSISNTATISVLADNQGDESTVDAYGIKINGALDGTLTNSGTIAATAIHPAAAPSDYSARAYGIQSFTLGASGGTILNTGTISASATHNGTYEATAIGINLGTISGTIDNRGVINATATTGSLGLNTGDGAANATGIKLATGLSGISSTGTLSNSGTINVTTHSPEDDTDAYGIRLGRIDSGGELSNTGAINVTATANDSAEAYGISANNIDGTLTNSGSITVSTTSNNADAPDVFGIRVSSVSGTLTNSGNIAVTASAVSTASAYGIMVNGTLSGTFDNSGTIIVSTSSVDNSDYAYGIYFDSDITGTFTNSGTIKAVQNDGNKAYAIKSDSIGTITNSNTGTLSGAVNIFGSFDNSGIHQLQLHPTNTTQSTIGDTATYNNGSSITITAASGTSGAITDGQVFDNVITATNSLSIDPSVLGVLEDDLLLYSFTAAQDGNNIDITASRDSSITSLMDGKLATQASILENAALNGSTSSELNNLAYQVNSASTVAEMTQLVNNNMMPALSGGSGFVAVQGISSAMNTISTMSSGNNQGIGVSSGDSPLGYRAWANVAVNNIEQDSGVAGADFDLDLNTFAFGADRELDDGIRLGASFANTRGDVDNQNGANLDMRATLLSLYGSKQLSDNRLLEGVITYGWGENDIQNGVSYDTQSLSLYGAYTYNIDISNALRISPKLSASYINLKEDGYRIGIIDVAKNTSEALEASLGADLSYQLSDKLNFLAHAAYGQSLWDDYRVTSTVVNGGPSFTVESDLDSNYITAGLGVTYTPSERLKLGFSVDRTDRGNFENDAFLLRMNYLF